MKGSACAALVWGCRRCWVQFQVEVSSSFTAEASKSMKPVWHPWPITSACGL